MNRLRRTQAQDSLELLLDTMCNTFGGIILIALLIALLSRDSTSDAGVGQRIKEQLEQVTRQTAEAERLQKTLREQTRTNVAPMMAMLEERDRLWQEIEASRTVIQSNTLTQASVFATNN